MLLKMSLLEGKNARGELWFLALLPLILSWKLYVRARMKLKHLDHSVGPALLTIPFPFHAAFLFLLQILSNHQTNSSMLSYFLGHLLLYRSSLSVSLSAFPRPFFPLNNHLPLLGKHSPILLFMLLYIPPKALT